MVSMLRVFVLFRHLQVLCIYVMDLDPKSEEDHHFVLLEGGAIKPNI